MLNATEIKRNLNDLLLDPTVSTWLKDAIRSLQKRDPVDAYLDSLRLMELFRHRLEDLRNYNETGERL